ncbi:MAG: SpoIIE family protein phosphatase, partial [Clostridia bacterium]|nr:SpoIIE family protein phosphatase [Clostridia bacterium]
LMRLDLYTGDGVVIKSGAAPSYLKSQNGLKRLCARTIPMGIFNIADTEEIKFNVKEGDVIIMASDGVAEDDSDSRPIEKYLDSHRSALPREMASDIIEMSRKSGKTDDLSVIAIKIFPQNY